jgi:hypothetical protein
MLCVCYCRDGGYLDLTAAAHTAGDGAAPDASKLAISSGTDCALFTVQELRESDLKIAK